MKVLVISAHADDEVFGAGGTIARHARLGDDVSIVFAADCKTARDNPRTPQLWPATHKAAAMLGLSDVAPRFLGRRGMTIADNPSLPLVQELEAIMADVRPDVVYTHHNGDLNSDHRALAQAVYVACRPLSEVAPRRLLAFEVLSATEQMPFSGGFAPSVFVRLTDADLDLKLRAAECYAEELREDPHPRTITGLRTRAAYWGQHAGCAYAEPFVLLREVVR